MGTVILRVTAQRPCHAERGEGPPVDHAAAGAHVGGDVEVHVDR